VLRRGVPGQRVREQVLHRQGRARAAGSGLQAEPPAALLQDGVRGEHDGAGAAVPLLQRGAGRARRAHLLAAGRLPPGGDVLHPAPHPAVDAEVGRAASVQRRVLRRRHLRVRRVRGRSHQQEAALEEHQKCKNVLYASRINNTALHCTWDLELHASRYAVPLNNTAQTH
jgi:hypothetical protein